MPFKDTKDGTTHYQDDGCGIPEHNSMTYIQKTIEDRNGWENDLMRAGDIQPDEMVMPKNIVDLLLHSREKEIEAERILFRKHEIEDLARARKEIVEIIRSQKGWDQCIHHSIYNHGCAECIGRRAINKSCDDILTEIKKKKVAGLKNNI